MADPDPHWNQCGSTTISTTTTLIMYINWWKTFRFFLRKYKKKPDLCPQWWWEGSPDWTSHQRWCPVWRPLHWTTYQGWRTLPPTDKDISIITSWCPVWRTICWTTCQEWRTLPHTVQRHFNNNKVVSSLKTSPVFTGPLVKSGVHSHL